MTHTHPTHTHIVRYVKLGYMFKYSGGNVSSTGRRGGGVGGTSIGKDRRRWVGVRDPGTVGDLTVGV